MFTNKEVLEKGSILYHYPCDTNLETGELESNGGVECIVLFKDKVFSIITDDAHNPSVILNANKSAVIAESPGVYKISFQVLAEDEDEAWEKVDEVTHDAIAQESTISNTFQIEKI